MKWFRQSGGERTPPPSMAVYNVLPPSILYALKYREAQLTQRNIEPLFKSNLAHLGFYLLMKASDNNDGLQVDLLHSAFANQFDYTQIDSSLITSALTHLNSQNPPSVSGQKLAEISRAGFQNWNNRFSIALGATALHNPDGSYFMVANAPYVGLDRLAAQSISQGKPLGILKPSRFDQTERPVGFLLEPIRAGLEITPLDRDFTRPDSAIIFDDVIHRGEVRDQVLNFWGEQTASTPDFITAVSVPPSA